MVDRRAGEWTGLALLRILRYRLGPGQGGTPQPAAVAAARAIIWRSTRIGADGAWNTTTAHFGLRLYDVLLPLDPKTYPRIIARNLDRLKQALPADSPDLLELESILTAIDHLPDRCEQGVEAVRERQREKEVIKKRLSQLAGHCPAVAEFIAANLQEINGAAGTPESFDDLNRLLDAQSYRLAHWKAAGDEINYRRFFDVNDLAAVCMEDAAVFEKSHRPVFEMLAAASSRGCGSTTSTDFSIRPITSGSCSADGSERWDRKFWRSWRT